jgi:hypothetical protein
VTGTEADNKPGTASGKTLAMLTPGQNELVSVCSANADSTVSFLGSTYSLSGQLVANITGWDSDPSSQTYGQMSGSVQANQFALNVPSLSATVALPVDLPFTFNVASIDAAFDSLGSAFVSASTAIPSDPTALSLVINYNNVDYTASGTVTGTGTCVDEGQDNLIFNASLSNPVLGPITMNLDMQAADTLTVIPEPSSSLLTMCGLGFLTYIGWRRKAKA